MLQEQHEIVVARQKRLEESLIRKQRAEQLDEETDWQLHQSSIGRRTIKGETMKSEPGIFAGSVTSGSRMRRSSKTAGNDGEASMTYSESEQMHESKPLSKDHLERKSDRQATSEEDGPIEPPMQDSDSAQVTAQIEGSEEDNGEGGTEDDVEWSDPVYSL